MIVFGWVVILLLTLWMWFATLAIAEAPTVITGKLGEAWFPLVITIALTALTYWTFPFEVTLK